MAAGMVAAAEMVEGSEEEVMAEEMEVGTAAVGKVEAGEAVTEVEGTVAEMAAEEMAGAGWEEVKATVAAAVVGQTAVAVRVAGQQVAVLLAAVEWVVAMEVVVSVAALRAMVMRVVAEMVEEL